MFNERTWTQSTMHLIETICDTYQTMNILMILIAFAFALAFTSIWIFIRLTKARKRLLARNCNILDPFSVGPVRSCEQLSSFLVSMVGDAQGKFLVKQEVSTKPTVNFWTRVTMMVVAGVSATLYLLLIAFNVLEHIRFGVLLFSICSFVVGVIMGCWTVVQFLKEMWEVRESIGLTSKKSE